MKKITLLLASVLVAAGMFAQPFSASYTFAGVNTTSGTTDPTAVPTATGVTFGSFSATGTPVNPNATGRFSFVDWSLGATNLDDSYAGLTGAINTAEYYEVTVSPAAGYTLTLDTIAFTFQRSGTGVRTYAVRSDADAYASNLSATITPANLNLSVQSGNIFFHNFDAVTTAQNGSTILLSGASFTNLTGPRTFRFYGFNAEGSGGTFSIDNVKFSGTATAPTVLTANFSSDVTDGCEALPVNFTDLSTSPDPITGWLWDFGDGTGTSTLQHPSYVYSTPGTYVVTLLVTDNTAATDTATASITVHEKPIAGITAPSGTCDATVVQFLDASSITSGSIVSWDWNFGDPASGASNTSTLEDPQHTYYTQASYTVTEIVTSDMGCKDTTTVMITVDSLGISYTSSTSGGTVTFTSTTWNGSTPYTWMWDFGDGSGPVFLPNPVHTYATPGMYNACVTVYDVEGCADTACQNIVILTTGIEEGQTGMLKISPNPSASGMFTLQSANGPGSILSVYSILGEKILSKEVSGETDLLDLSSQPNGTYFIHISLSGKKDVLTKRIIISR